MLDLQNASPTTAAAAAVRATKVYGHGEAAVVALDEVSVELPAGRFTAVMGPSGSGKSTLLHCLAGLDRLSSGTVLVDGVDLGSLSDKALTRLRRERIGFVFQGFNLVPTLSARENIALPLTLGGRRPDPAWLGEVVGTVGLGDRLGHRPSELPAIVFADEPTGNLDTRAGNEILGFLRRAVDELGQTVVVVTHDPVAAGYADRALFLADGRIVDAVDDPSPERVLDHLKSLEVAR
jgi:putative ABC transport system ATP-binding protein